MNMRRTAARWVHGLVVAWAVASLLAPAALAERPITLEPQPAERQEAPSAETPRPEGAPVVVTADGAPVTLEPGYELEIAVASEEQLAAIQGLGLGCPALGACRVSVTDVQHTELKRLGVVYQVVGGAIKAYAVT